MGRHSHSHHSSRHHSSSHYSNGHSHSNGSEHHSNSEGETGKNKGEATEESNEGSKFFPWRSYGHSRQINCSEVMENGKLVKKCEDDDFSLMIIFIIMAIIMLMIKIIQEVKKFNNK